MTRLQVLLAAYAHYDTIFTGAFLAATWAATTAHLVDWIAVHSWRRIIPAFWGILLAVYVLGIIYVGLSF